MDQLVIYNPKDCTNGHMNYSQVLGDGRNHQVQDLVYHSSLWMMYIFFQKCRSVVIKIVIEGEIGQGKKIQTGREQCWEFYIVWDEHKRL